MQKYLFYFNFSRNKGKLYFDVLLWKQVLFTLSKFWQARLSIGYDSTGSQ